LKVVKPKTAEENFSGFLFFNTYNILPIKKLIVPYKKFTNEQQINKIKNVLNFL